MNTALRTKFTFEIVSGRLWAGIFVFLTGLLISLLKLQNASAK